MLRALWPVYLANRGMEAVLRSVAGLNPLVTGMPDGGPAPASADERRAVRGLLEMLAQEHRLIELAGRSIGEQSAALGGGDAGMLMDAAAATGRVALRLREALHARLQLARLLAGDRSLPVPSAQLGAMAGRLATTERRVRTAARRTVADLLAAQLALASTLEESELAQLALALAERSDGVAAGEQRYAD